MICSDIRTDSVADGVKKIARGCSIVRSPRLIGQPPGCVNIDVALERCHTLVLLAISRRWGSLHCRGNADLWNVRIQRGKDLGKKLLGSVDARHGEGRSLIHVTA